MVKDERKATRERIHPRTTLRDRVRAGLMGSGLCLTAFDELENDIEVQTILEDTNRMAIDRLGYSDHGHVHSLIVVKNAMELFDLLTTSLEPTIVKEGTGTLEDARLIVLLAGYLHDIGMSVHREGHNQYSVTLACPIIDRILTKVYPDDRHKQVHIRGHILHAILCHDKATRPSTVEAGIVGISDALDMTSGRARIPFKAGSINIHSASAMAIEEVKISRGLERAVRIEVSMSNASGIFQIQELLEKKIRSASLITDHIELYAVMTPKESRILDKSIRIL